MMTEISIVSLSQLLNNIHLSSSHIDEAARFYVRHAQDQKSQQSLCEEWSNHFHLAKGNVDGDKVIISLLYMAQRVIEQVLKQELQSTYSTMKDTFKKQIIKAFTLMKDHPYPQEVKKQIKDILHTWEEKQLFNKQEIQIMQDLVDPVRIQKDKIRNQFAPPPYLVNYAKNYRELQIRLQKMNEFQSKLDDIINNGGERLQQYDILLENYTKSVESVQKYRKLVVQDIIDELKELDKIHSKSIIDLKYIAQRVNDLNSKKEKRLQQEYYNEII